LKRIATILSFVILVYSHSNAQYFQSTNYKEGSGLPSSETYMVYQDSKGFVWIATDNGVVKFDGHEFVTYNIATGLTDNTVFGFYEDHKGRIWFRTYNGALSYLENDSIKSYKYNAELKSFMKQAILAKIEVDSADNVNFSTMYEAVAGRVDAQGHVTKTSLNNETRTEYDWKFLAYVGNSRMLYANFPPRNIRTLRIDGKEFPIELDDSRNQNNWLIASVWWRGKLYFSLYKNLFEYDGKSIKKVFFSEKESFICMYVDHQDRLWVGSYNSGVMIFDDPSFTNPASLSSLENISISSVMQDYEDGTWISTLDQGVFYFPNLELEHYKLPDTRRISAVLFCDDQVFLGNYGGDVYTVSDKGKVKLINPGVGPVSLLFEDNSHHLWISDGAGTHIYQTGITVGADVDKRGIVYKTLIQVGDTIIGSHSMGLDKLSPKGKTYGRMMGRRRPNVTVSLNNNIYLGGLNGVDRFSIHLTDDSTKIIDYRTASLINLDNRFIATGTVGHGLYFYDAKEQRLTHLPIPDVTSIYSMSADWPERRIWVGTEKGLFQLDFEKDSTDIRLKHFAKADGLMSTKINHVGRIGNNVWAISDLGISSVPLRHFTERDSVPKFYINRIMFQNESIMGNANSVKTEEQDMVLDVRAITFKGRPTTFRYRLNAEDPWRMVSAGSIFLTDMKPNTYHIEVQASLNSETWTKSLTTQIDVRAQWWDTWAFRWSVIFLICVLGYVAYLLRINAIRRKHRYLELINHHQQKLIDSEIHTQERERKRIASDLHDGIGTSLSSIKMQVADAMLDDADRNARGKEINDHLTDVIDDIKRIVYDLHPPGLERYGLQSGLKNLIERINKSADVNVIFDYYGQREIIQPVSITIFRILQELLNNTLKHARASEIRIHINEFDDEINIMYEDNGIGMIGSRFTGLGLHSIESRVRSLNGRMSWESNHKGTFYNFDIPF
jgi:signal transduction histidine kinase/ligand-binding sensor domain-containing protein